MKNKMNQEINDLMSKNPDNWKGIFYVNSNDSRMFVPKLNPKLGLTLNFGNKYALIGLVVIILIIIASNYFTLPF